MKYLNLGCGNNYIISDDWVNLDYNPIDNHVISCDLKYGIPYENDTFDFIYQSHIIEHFNMLDGNFLIQECFRVLKPGGVLRLVTPDFERQLLQYLVCLQNCRENDNEINRANYHWMQLEIIDQIARHQPGGNMGEYLKNAFLVNWDFILSRIGGEASEFREFHVIKESTDNPQKTSYFDEIKKNLFFRLKQIKNRIRNFKRTDEFKEIGRFRLGGEIHQWMYDTYSIKLLLKEKGFHDIRIVDPLDSRFYKWKENNLDTKDGKVRKPDSMFVEAEK